MPATMIATSIDRPQGVSNEEAKCVTSGQRRNMSDYGLLLAQFDADISRRNHQEVQLRKLSTEPSAEQLELQSQIGIARQDQQQELTRLEEEYQSVRNEAAQHFNEELSHAHQAHQSIFQSVNAEAKQETTQLERQREESEWVVSSLLDDNAEDSPLREFEKFQSIFNKTLEEHDQLLAILNEHYRELSEKRGWSGTSHFEPKGSPKNRKLANEHFQKAIEESQGLLTNIHALLLPKIFLGFRGLIMFFTMMVIVTVPVFLFVDPEIAGVTGARLSSNWIGISAIGGAIGGLFLTGILYTVGALRQSDLFRQLLDSQALAGWLHQQWLILAKEGLDKQKIKTTAKQRKIERERQEALDRYETAHAERLAIIEAARDEKLNTELEKYETERDQTTAQRDQQLEQIDSEHRRRLQESETRCGGDLQRLETQLKQLQNTQSRKQSEMWAALKSEWETSSRQFFETVKVVGTADKETNPQWNQLNTENWQPSKLIPRGIRFGKMHVDLNEWPSAISDEARLAPRLSTFQLPGEAAFPGATSTLFKSPNVEARKQAIDALQSMMLRLLLLVPPGKLRFTMLDPIGLGESFGGFMHLADYDDLMISKRIWTEPGQIEARLANLTEHMENVFQTYLRNEFQTIEEYNESAGEVAEPYHILVISDFPSKFSEIAARRLVSIVNSGPRCGVYTLMNLDPTKQMPNNFELADLQPHMNCYQWQENCFHSTEALLSPWPVTIDSPPKPESFTSIVKMVGDASKDARRVEVSFDRITPKAGEIWSRDSRHELIIPLGRAGATKLQTMQLGKGTSQHMLVAGKTGSGKSTFLHILVTNLALFYSPNEVNFFLIDFKKGVEFKDYATYKLPHAQVVAIESDREFGVSALQRLDEMLQERGELFRKHSVQDIAGFRNANPDKPLPRIMLIVDEFQEFFIEDDKLSQSAALLLDRLVRQGRAFGIHVILGSQTLGGAYSLARTTMGQVAVRVALQCSEADAHLILSEDNTAARLLTRPGEAIYNDANGMMEGNHPFQIAWVADQERRHHLEALQNKSERQGIETKPAIVFEGNIPADLRINTNVQQLAETFLEREEPLSAPTIWLGDAVEIQPPTAVTFHRQSGSHLLIVGQDADAARGIMTTAAITLAASSKASSSTPATIDRPEIYVFDGNPQETLEAKRWKSLVNLLPISTRLISPRESARALETLTTELQQRTDKPDESYAPIFVLIDNIAKFRDLRKAEDDFSMGGFGSSTEEKPAEPGKLFADLLTEGPISGIHFIIWCDSFNNFERSFSRQINKELELRVALQMNAADSSNLIDSPLASRLGTHRALLYREETGLCEKFRPYGVPEETWVNDFIKTMNNGPPTDFATDLEEFEIL